MKKPEPVQDRSFVAPRIQSEDQKSLHKWSLADNAHHEQIVKWLEANGLTEVPSSLFLQTQHYKAEAARCHRELLVRP